MGCEITYRQDKLPKFQIDGEDSVIGKNGITYTTPFLDAIRAWKWFPAAPAVLNILGIRRKEAQEDFRTATSI